MRRGLGIEGVVFGHHIEIGRAAGGIEDRAIAFGQAVPCIGADKDVEDRVRLPPAGIIVIGRDLVEAELFVVMGADPLHRVDGATFQRGIDVAAGDLLRHDAQLFDHLARQSGDPHLQALPYRPGC